MMLWELFLEPSNLIFSISLILMLLLGIVECLLLVIGTSSQGLMEQFVPDQLHEVQTVEVDLDGNNLFLTFLDWLYLGRIPMLVWLVIFLTVYSLTGFITQMVFFSFTQFYLPLWLIAPACLIACMPLVRLSALVISRILPKDETTAIYSEALIGRTAQIILGEAKQGYPAQAKVKDQFGQTHYILVEPEVATTFSMGQDVILTQKTKIGFKAITHSI